MSSVKPILENIEEFLIGISLMVMLAIVFLNAISRYLINLDMASAQEIVTSLFPWVTFLGGAVAIKRKGHVGLSLLTDRFPEGLRKYMPLFSAFCIIVLFGIIFFLGSEMVMFEKETHQRTPALELPTWIIELSIPLGSLAIVVRTIQTACNQRRTK
jgi:TRAP-type C4-dicarboxylate transport system permease small subunit